MVVNLYPFEQTVAKPKSGCTTPLRTLTSAGRHAAQRGQKSRQRDGGGGSGGLRGSGETDSATGDTTLELRRKLAAKVFARTAAYDGAIAAHLQKEFAAGAGLRLPASLNVFAPLAQPLRYGENPHQAAALYGGFNEFFQQLHGKELSYNNILDLTAAANLIAEFTDDPPTLAILKHTNPCGVGQGANLREAWDKAFATDKQAPFGGIIAVNQSA